MTKVIVSNSVKCKSCQEVIYSASVHDYKSCKCRNIAVDGGTSYLRRVGNPLGYKDLSIEIEEESLNRVIDTAQEMVDTGRNTRGIVYGVLRQLRIEGLLKL